MSNSFSFLNSQSTSLLPHCNITPSINIRLHILITICLQGFWTWTGVTERGAISDHFSVSSQLKAHLRLMLHSSPSFLTPCCNRVCSYWDSLEGWFYLWRDDSSAVIANTCSKHSGYEQSSRSRVRPFLQGKLVMIVLPSIKWGDTHYTYLLWLLSGLRDYIRTEPFSYNKKYNKIKVRERNHISNSILFWWGWITDGALYLFFCDHSSWGDGYHLGYPAWLHARRTTY